MPFAQADIDKAGKAALDFYLKNDPIDQIVQERPLYNLLTKSKATFPGGKQYIVEQLRKSYDSNLQAYRLDQTVTYNSKDPLFQAEYPWTNYHDGFGMTEDEMRQNGIVLTDDRESKASQAEVVQLTNMLKEYYFDLKEGAQKAFDYKLHQDGTEGVDDIVGLDALISLTPTTGTVGGINRATAGNEWWRNNASTAIASGTAGALVAAFDEMFRKCTQHGGMPDKIIVGNAMMVAYRAACKDEIQRHVVVTGQTKQLDPSVSGLYYKGIELVWDPTFEDLDAALSPATPWSKRAYMLNSKTIKLRVADGGDWIARHPSRPPDKYVHYRAITWTGGMTLNRSNANAVLAIA